MAASNPKNSVPDDKPGVKPSRAVAVLSVRVLVCTGLLIAVLGPSLYLWHAHQVKCMGAAFLERADKLEASQDWWQAAGYLHKYLRLHPDDYAVRVRLAKTMDQGAADARRKRDVVNCFYQTLGLIPAEEQPALRRRLAELLLELGRFGEAEAEAEKLLADDAADPQGQRLQALALHGEVQRGAVPAQVKGKPSVSQVVATALASNPGDIRLSALLAQIYRDEEKLLDDKTRSLPRAERESHANALMNQMVEANRENAEAYLARYRYCVAHKLADADQDLQAALKYGPDNLEVLLTAAQSLGMKNPGKAPDAAALAAARAYAERALHLAPENEHAYLLLGSLWWRSNERKKAVAVWEQGLKKANRDSLLLHQNLAQAYVEMGETAASEVELNSFDRCLSATGPLLPTASRSALETFRDLARAKWHLRKNDRDAAIPLLKRIVGQGKTALDSKERLEAWGLLAGIWMAEGDWNQAAMAYEQLAGVLPRNAKVRLAAANAWAKAGQWDMALRYGEQVRMIQDSPEARLFLANVQFRSQLARPREERNWDAFRKALGEAVKVADKSTPKAQWQAELLQAEAWLVGAFGKTPEEARKECLALLQAAEKKNPQTAELLQILPFYYERLKCPADADRAVAALAKLPNQQFAAAAVQFRLCMMRRQYAQARAVVQAAIKTLPAQALPLQLNLATVYMAEGNTDEAVKVLQKLVDEFPQNPAPLRQLAELASEAGNMEELQRWNKQLREVEGADGAFWRYYRAKRLLVQVRDAKDPQFYEAEKLADELQTLRPFWPMSHVLQALAAQRQGKFDKAIGAYENAIRLGERRTRVYEQLVQLLYAKRRFAEAEKYLSQLQEEVPNSANLSKFEISLATQAGDLDRALAAARRGVESRPDDVMAQVWLGQVLLAGGQVAEAEQTLQNAVKLAADDVRAYNALLEFYLRTKRPAEAAKILADLEKTAKMPPPERAFVLAQGYERLSRAQPKNADYAKRATAEYEKAQQLDPDNLAVLERRAAFLLTRDPDTAESVLHHMLDLDLQSRNARRLLAMLLATRGGNENWEESQRLLEDSGGKSSSEEQRLQAILLLRRGGKDNIHKARQILEKLVVDVTQSTADDKLLLARILEMEGQIELARQQYISVAGRSDATAGQITQYVAFLLRHKKDQEAAPWFARLQKRYPDNLEALALRARWLKTQQRTAEIAPAIEAVADKLLKALPAEGAERKAAETRLLQQIGDAYLAGDQYAAAENWYRRLQKIAPEQYVPLMTVLGRQKRWADAILVCTEAAKTDASAQPGILLANLLASGDAGVADCELAERLLTQTLIAHADNVELLNAVAAVRVLEKRLEDAVGLYRRIIAINPKHVLALNNLATLLGENEKTRSEAVRSIDQAIDAAGRLPALLDTKGTVLVYAGKAAEALPILQEATAASVADPRFYLHLGLAYDGAGKREDARVALQKARKGKLDQQLLTPTEQRLLKELEQKLGM